MILENVCMDACVCAYTALSRSILTGQVSFFILFFFDFFLFLFFDSEIISYFQFMQNLFLRFLNDRIEIFGSDKYQFKEYKNTYISQKIFLH